jgi:hypothetical protein
LNRTGLRMKYSLTFTYSRCPQTNCSEELATQTAPVRPGRIADFFQLSSWRASTCAMKSSRSLGLPRCRRRGRAPARTRRNDGGCTAHVKRSPGRLPEDTLLTAGFHVLGRSASVNRIVSRDERDGVTPWRETSDVLAARRLSRPLTRVEGPALSGVEGEEGGETNGALSGHTGSLRTTIRAGWSSSHSCYHDPARSANRSHPDHRTGHRTGRRRHIAVLAGYSSCSWLLLDLDFPCRPPVPQGSGNPFSALSRQPSVDLF